MPLALILMLLFGSGATLTVDASKPGDVLYPVKINVNEKLESLMAVTSSAKKSVEFEHAKERQREARALYLTQIEDGDDDTDEIAGVSSSTSIRQNRSKDAESEREEGIKVNTTLRLDSDDDDESEDDERSDDDNRTTIIPNVTPTANNQTNIQIGFTFAEVAKHNKSTDCYSVVRGNVYDLTSWIRQHPGGSQAIISMCGLDATSAFVAQHNGQGRPESELASYKIGVIK